TYFFEIRKCKEAGTGCTICRPPRSRPKIFSKLQLFPNPIPKANEDHYMPFCEIYGKDTCERYRPLLLQKVNASTSTTTTTIDGLGANGMGFSPRAQYATNVHTWSNALNEKNLHKNFLETIDYTCSIAFYGISDFTKVSPPSFRNNNNCSINNDEVELQDTDNDINGKDDYDGDGGDGERFIDDGDYDSDGMKDGERIIDNSDYECNSMENGERFIGEKSVNESFTELQNTVTLETLFKQVFVNAKLTCATPVEVPYFSSHIYPDICFQCDDTEILSPTPASKQPYCSECYATVKTKKKEQRH
ncbi:19837_t:CDS:2, partial [Gigaspora rosea]